MTTLPSKYKRLTFELSLDTRRNTVEVISQIAHALHVAIGEQPEREYIQLTRIKPLREKETAQ